VLKAGTLAEASGEVMFSPTSSPRTHCKRMREQPRGTLSLGNSFDTAKRTLRELGVVPYPWPTNLIVATPRRMAASQLEGVQEIDEILLFLRCQTDLEARIVEVHQVLKGCRVSIMEVGRPGSQAAQSWNLKLSEVCTATSN